MVIVPRMPTVNPWAIAQNAKVSAGNDVETVMTALGSNSVCRDAAKTAV